MIEQLAADPAEQCLAQLRVMVGPCDDHVGTQIDGARQQNIGNRKATARAFFGLRLDPVPLQVPDDALEPGLRAVQIGFPRSDTQHRDRLDAAAFADANFVDPNTGSLASGGKRRRVS